MYRVFNMGIGFCLIVEEKQAIIRAVRETFEASQDTRFETHIIGQVVADERKRVFLSKQGLVGEDEEFTDLAGL